MRANIQIQIRPETVYSIAVTLPIIVTIITYTRLSHFIWDSRISTVHARVQEGVQKCLDWRSLGVTTVNGQAGGHYSVATRRVQGGR